MCRMRPLEAPDSCGVYVQKFNLHDMYELGQRLVPLKELKWEDKIGDRLGNLWFARAALETYTSEASPLLEAAKRAGRKVITSIGGIIPTDFDEATKLDKETQLSYWGYRIKEDLAALESVLANEMPGVPAYIVSPKGIYKTEDLIEHAEKQFPQELQSLLAQQTVLDIREAGKCLAFSLPTACSFHLWRALETVMDAYYVKLASKSFDDAKVSRNWGAKIKALQEANAEASVTKFLDHIREQYRNPQTHPEEMVELNEALMLFGAAASAITAIVIAMDKVRPSLSGPAAEASSARSS